MPRYVISSLLTEGLITSVKYETDQAKNLDSDYWYLLFYFLILQDRSEGEGFSVASLPTLVIRRIGCHI